MMRTVYFHEDDYCQVEILPVAAVNFVSDEMRSVEEFSQAHSDGAGFTRMYVRNDPPTSLASLGITVDDVRAALEPLLPAFDQVMTGYSTHRELLPNAVGWGIADYNAVFVTVGESGVIQAAWLCAGFDSPERVDRWCSVLKAFPRASGLVLADWNTLEMVPLADEVKLAAYLRPDEDEQAT
jgi:hypothetical protein